MYQPGSYRRKVAQDFLIHLPSAVHAFIFIVDREVNLCVLTIESFSHLLGIFIFYFYFLFYFSEEKLKK